MTATVTDPAHAPGGSRRAIALLSLSQGFYTIMTMLLVTVSALAGHMLAEDKSLATLPFALTFIANKFITPGSGLLEGFSRTLKAGKDVLAVGITGIKEVS